MSISEDDWKKKLTPAQYHVLRERGTEPPYSGVLLYNDKDGVYACAACGNKLFDSSAKFDSVDGWPDFYQSLPGAITKHPDPSFGMHRTELRCAKCGSHI